MSFCVVADIARRPKNVLTFFNQLIQLPLKFALKRFNAKHNKSLT